MLKVAQIVAAIALIALFLSLAGISYLSSPPSGNPGQEQSAAKTKEGNQTEEKRTFRGFIRFLFPDAISYFTFWLTLSTVVLGIVAIIQIGYLRRAESISADAANAAKKAADVAEGTLVATNRPWIAIKSISIISPLIFEPTPDEHEARIDLAIVVKNVGKSPAIRVQVNVNLTISNTVDLRSAQRTLADAIKAGREEAEAHPNIIQPEITLFPGDEKTITVTAWMSPEPLARFREWAGRNPGAIVLPAIVGAVYYGFTFSKGHHETGIIYGLRKRTPYPAGQALPAYSTVPAGFPITNYEGAIHPEGTIPAVDLILQQDSVGTGPID